MRGLLWLLSLDPTNRIKALYYLKKGEKDDCCL